MNQSIISSFPFFPEAPASSRLSYLSRLDRLWQKMADDSICILVSNPESRRSNDTHYPYRQSSEIVYLNGFPEPECLLILSKLSGKQELIMLLRPRDQERETWDGRRYGVRGAKAGFLASRAYPLSEFNRVLGDLLEKSRHVYYRFGQHHEFDRRFNLLWQNDGQKTLSDPAMLTDELRLFKSAEEIKIMSHAALVSAEAHKQAMLACKPGLSEYHLQALIEFVFRCAGACAPAYGTIVAAGENACILHYVENNKVLESGELVLIDAGAEFGSLNGGYAADITRTFPVNGKFSPAQKELYELVLQAQLAAIRKAAPQVRLVEVHKAAQQVLKRGLRKLGILGADAESQGLKLSDLMPHGTSHWLGIDVHDVGSYDDPSDSARQSRVSKRRLLEPGMMITVEPGIYIKKNEKRVPARYRGIGIRIEDDILITENGNTVLTGALPKTVQEIETLMAGASSS